MTKTKTKINKLKKNNCSKFVVYKKCNFLKCKKIKGLENENGYINKYIDFNTFEDNKTKIPKGYKKVNYDITDIKESWCDNSKQLLSKDNEMYKKIKKKKYENIFYT